MIYREAYDKIIDAYFKDEIRPYDDCFCFCGTLAAGTNWLRTDYSAVQLRKMEGALLETIHRDTVGFIGEPIWVKDVYYEHEDNHLAFHECRQKNGGEHEIKKHPNYESALFAGMSAALDVLKQIHIERGEVIDEVPVFTKRQKVS